MTQIKVGISPVLLCLLVVLGTACPVKSQNRLTIDEDLMTEGFLAAHPDLRWRREGLRSFEQGDHVIAMRQFKRSARYADKPSQVLIAHMYWSGAGMPVDRALAYAWMDVAGERHSPEIIALREGYWDQLTEAERESAIEVGQAIYAEYGDDVARPRLARILERERRKIAGSRVGSVGRVTVIPFTGPRAQGGTLTLYGHGGSIGNNAPASFSGEQYYAAEYWEPEKYFERQDRLERQPLRPRVTVGELAPVRVPVDNPDLDPEPEPELEQD
ncbi:MAG: hypothetical protein NVV60_00270 [Luteimonas sp.]|nr:hypothetical protein [Luteimonas sp.]